MLSLEGKEYFWDSKKNDLLKRTRGISFEEVVESINSGNLFSIVENPKKDLYPGQLLFYVVIKNYIYVVPFRILSSRVLLITIFPSRVLTKKYLRGAKKWLVKKKN